MAFDAFLKIDGIDGESTDDKHKSWIEILSYSHGLSQPIGGPVSSSGGASAERCDHAPFTIVKELDKASPKIALACCRGDHINEVVLTLNRAGGDKVQYMEYKLSKVMITSVAPSGNSAGGGTLPLEEVGMTYAKIEWKYTQQKRADGSGGGQVAGGWDLTANKAV